MVQPNGAAAVAASRRSNTCPVGMCLSEVQEWWGSGHAWPDAITQWNNTIQHRDRNIPIGAPVFYSGGKHGHIAIYVGNGMIRSTDAPSNRTIGEVPLDWPKARWNHTYLGWGSKLAGRVLPLSAPVIHPPAPAHTPAPPVGSVVYVSKLHYGQMDSDSVKALQARLNSISFPPHKNVPVTGNYLGETDASVRAWQAFIGDRADAPGRSSIGPKQAARLWAGANVNIKA